MLRRALAWGCICLCAVLTGWMLFHHLKPAPASFVLPASGAATQKDKRFQVPWPEGSVNPNEASVKQLNMLPGIGPVTAINIVEERTQHGNFVFPEDLLSVKGIGPATLRSLWEYLYLPVP